MRSYQRNDADIRPVTIEPNFVEAPLGSALISCGRTRVLCCASVEESVPAFLVGRGKGWLTAEYSLLPGSTTPRARREVTHGSVGGRTSEIQRLIGRSLRMALDMKKLGERTIYIDCDVLQADGGTRTAAITGAYVALALAVDALMGAGKLSASPLVRQVAAVSVGVVDGRICCDLDYQEDYAAEVDMNIVMSAQLELLEIQGTAEQSPFSVEQLGSLVASGRAGIEQLLAVQNAVLSR